MFFMHFRNIFDDLLYLLYWITIKNYGKYGNILYK